MGFEILFTADHVIVTARRAEFDSDAGGAVDGDEGVEGFEDEAGAVGGGAAVGVCAGVGAGV